MLPKSVSERHMGEQGGSLQPQYRGHMTVFSGFGRGARSRSDKVIARSEVSGRSDING